MKAFLAGLGTGVVLGVLFAPQSGEQTREQVRTKTDELTGLAQERVRDLGGNIQGKVKEFGSEAKNMAQSIASKAGLLVRLNTASRDDLMTITGIGPVTADKIIAGRPYLAAQQVVDRGIVPAPIFKELQKEFEAA
jgi:gas vesicle protein